MIRKQKWKTNIRIFQATNEISHEKTWTWLRKENLKKETEFLMITAQNYAITTNYVKGKIDNIQQNCKCWLGRDIDETINHIISKCRKLAQKKYKTGNDWMRKLIHWELCKKFKFDRTNKWNWHNRKSVLENEMYKVLWDFEI